MTEPGFHLFTYGTLRSGDGPAHELLDGCRKVGEGVVHGALFDLGAFPALLLSGSDPVPGEVWWCPASKLPALDGYEGVDEGLFRRAATRVDGYACWIYVAGPRLGRRLVPEALVRADNVDGS